MKNLNIGIANLIVSNRLKKSYFDESLITESKQIAFDFLNIIKNSPILQLEFRVFNNILNKHIDNDTIATRYIDNNIKLFEIYTINEIENEHNKLIPFITEDANALDDEKTKLYNAINTLIFESLKNYNDIDVDAMHESFVLLLNHIKMPKNSIVEGDDGIDNEINDDIIEIAISKFNEKYSTMNDDDRNMLHKLINANDNEKIDLLESLKRDTLIILENINNNSINDKINKAINKIKNITFSKETIDDDIINLYEFKKQLL